MEASKTSRLILTTTLLLAGTTVFLLATRWGIGTSSDSAHYIRSARHMLDREEIKVTIDSRGTSAHYPPLYASALALASIGGADPLHAARWVHLVLFLANVCLIIWLAYRFGNSLAAAATAGAMVIFSPSSIAIHAMALSEPLFILLTFATIALLAEQLRRPRRGLLVAVAIATSLAMLARYVGVALVPAGVIALLMARARPLRARVIDAATYAAIAILPLTAWTLRNRLMLGTTMNRDITVHLISINHLKMAAMTISSWIVPGENFTAIHGSIAILIIAGLAAATWAMRKQPLAIVLGLFILCFALLLAGSISLVDFHTPLDERILSPIFFASVILLINALWTAKRFAIVARSAAVILVAGATIRGGMMTARLHRDGLGYARRIWRESPIIEVVKTLPDETWVYSNAADAVYLLSGRLLSIPIPAKSVASSLQPNPEYEAQLEAMRQQLISGRGVLLYLDRYEDKRWYYPTGAELKKRLGLHRLAHRGDGDIYDYVAAVSQPTTREE